MSFVCRPLREGDVDALVTYLGMGLPADSFLLDALDRGGTAGFLGAFLDAKLCGVALVRRGGITLAAATLPEAARALAGPIHARGPWSSVVGPETPSREVVAALRTPEPFRVDRVQAFMAVHRGDPVAPGHPRLRRATVDDLDDLVPLIARYRVEDGLSAAGEDHSAWIRAHSAERVASGHLFLVEQGRRIVFTGAFNYAGRAGAGLGGIYTVPEARGNGIGTRATAEIVRIALGMGPVATLHVDTRNAAAIRVYEKVGFRREGEFRLTFR